MAIYHRALHRDPGAGVGGQTPQQHSLCGHLKRRVLAMARLSRTGVLAIAGLGKVNEFKTVARGVSDLVLAA